MVVKSINQATTQVMINNYFTNARGYELAIIFSYPTSASGIIVLFKTPTNIEEFFPTLFVKTTDFQLVCNFEQTRTVTIFGEHGITAFSKIQVVIYYQCCILIG